mgnify:CR=1 FL=1
MTRWGYEPFKEPFLESFQGATSLPFGYLILDLHPHTPSTQRVRTNTLPMQQRFTTIDLREKENT